MRPFQRTENQRVDRMFLHFFGRHIELFLLSRTSHSPHKCPKFNNSAGRKETPGQSLRPWKVFDRYQSLSDQILGLKTKIIDLYLKNKLLSTRYNIHIGLND